MAKGSFVFYNSILESIEVLTKDTRIINDAMAAVVRYGVRGEKYQGEDPVINCAMLQAMPLIDANKAKTNRGGTGAPTGNQNAKKQTTGLNETNHRLEKTNHSFEKTNHSLSEYIIDVDVDVDKDVDVDIDGDIDKESESVARARARRTQPTPSKKNDLNIPDDASDEYKKFIPWVRKIAPHFFNGCEHIITQTQMEKLINGFGKDQFFDIFSKIENRKDLRKRYTNMYLTTLNWLKNERDQENE